MGRGAREAHRARDVLDRVRPALLDDRANTAVVDVEHDGAVRGNSLGQLGHVGRCARPAVNHYDDWVRAAVVWRIHVDELLADADALAAVARCGVGDRPPNVEVAAGRFGWRRAGRGIGWPGGWLV